VKFTLNISQFRQEETGAILVIWGVCLAIFLGIVAMSFDFGRLAIAQSELQSYVDSVALAAAGELDGQDDSIARATAAAASLISDRQTFASDGILSGSEDYTLTFLTTLPPADTDDITPYATTNPKNAAFIHVYGTPQSVGLTFARAFAALTGIAEMNNIVTASATAGMTSWACDITPLMFCVPSEDINNPGTPFTAENNIGRLVRLRSGGQGAAWGPGDFGFLDPSILNIDLDGPCSGLSGNNLDACLMGAIGSITECVETGSGVNTEPGQKVGIEDAVFNVRFDIYKSVMNGEKNDPNYAPAPNVIKGIVPQGGGQCVGQQDASSTNTMGLPQDNCFSSGSCPYARIGDGDWDFLGYVATNYPDVPDETTGLPVPNPLALAYFGDMLSELDANGTIPTRYEVYIAEIEGAGPGSPILPALDAVGNPMDETGLPTCQPGIETHPERRVVVAAGIDCDTNPIAGQTNNVPVQEYFKLFLTEPVGDDGSTSPPTVDIWVEIVGSAGGGGAGGGTPAGKFHDVVQLYR